MNKILTMIILDFLFSVGNKVGQTMTATAKQLKQTVEQTVRMN